MRSLEVHTSPRQIDWLLDGRGSEASSADSLWGGMDHSAERHLLSHRALNLCQDLDLELLKSLIMSD